jgi:hypothetical protein
MKSTLLFVLFLSFSMCCFAQKQTITGTIYDEDKNVLADANVIVKNSKKGTITDERGQFSIDIEAKAILEVSYLGFETKEVAVRNQKEMIVMLTSQSEEIEAVIVIAQKGIIRCKKPTSTIITYTRGCGLRIQGVSIEKNIQKEESIVSKLFPNPSANGFFQLQLNETYMKVNIEVFNMNGQLVQSNTHTQLSKNPQIDLSKQAKGIYLIRIVADGKVLETKKAIRS